MARIIGIDLGTSNSAAAAMIGGKPTIVPSAEGTSLGGKAFPSYVAFTKDNQLLVGEPARRQAVSNIEGTVYAIKRKMGTDYKVKLGGKEYTPQQISAFILQKVKRDAEAFLGEEIEKVVITVPAYFNDNQRQATKDAGQIAGLDVVRIVNEPTAACLAYGLDKGGQTQQILIFDLGGGTLDVTVMHMAEGVFEVLSTSGDTQLGGTDMDNTMVEYIAETFNKQEGVDLRKDKMAMQRIREAAEKAKIELSTTLDTEINLPFISGDPQSGPKHLVMKLSRAKLEDLVNPIIDRCKGPLKQALSDAKLQPSDVSKIIMVGGPTRMPAVQKFVEQHIGKAVERGIDPMECVAMGAAVQGAVLTGDIKDVLLLDVTPLSLGIETLGGVFTTLIDRNTTIPTKKSQVFSTAADNQTSVEVHVLQGARAMAGDNTSLGKFQLVGIAPAPRGVAQVEVGFDIDANGILHVSAKDLGTGKEQSMKITAPMKLDKSEIDKMVKDADKFAEEDKNRKEQAEVRNQADTLVYTTERALIEHGSKVDEATKKAITDAIADCKKALEKGEAEEIKRMTTTLQQVSMKLGEAVYAQASKAGAAAEGGPNGESHTPPQGEGNGNGQTKNGKEDVQEAEFKVEGEK